MTPNPQILMRYLNVFEFIPFFIFEAYFIELFYAVLLNELIPLLAVPYPFAFIFSLALVQGIRDFTFYASRTVQEEVTLYSLL